jgi:hypothetical protein
MLAAREQQERILQETRTQAERVQADAAALRQQLASTESGHAQMQERANELHGQLLGAQRSLEEATNARAGVEASSAEAHRLNQDASLLQEKLKTAESARDQIAEQATIHDASARSGEEGSGCS